MQKQNKREQERSKEGGDRERENILTPTDLAAQRGKVVFLL